MKIAITGTFGAGKSSVSEILTLLGYPVVNCDLLAKSYYNVDSPIYEKLVNVLKVHEGIVIDGTIQLNALSTLFFKDMNVKASVESLIHTQLLNDLNVYSGTHKHTFVEVPLLFEVGWEQYFDHILVITCDQDVAIERLNKYRKIEKEEYSRRMKHQLSKEYKITRASYVIENNGDKKELEGKVKQWLKTLQLSS